MTLDHIGELPEVREYERFPVTHPGWRLLADAALAAADRHVAALEAAMTAKATPDVDDDVLADWEDFWRAIVCPDGTLDLAQVARELFDYHVAMKQVAIVYCDLTGSRFSKPNTRAEYVIEAAYEHIEKPLIVRVAEMGAERERNIEDIVAARQAALDDSIARTKAEDALAELDEAVKRAVALVILGGDDKELVLKVMTDAMISAFAFVADREHRRAEQAEVALAELKTKVEQCHIYQLPVVAGDREVHWIDGLDHSEVSHVLHADTSRWKPSVYGNARSQLEAALAERDDDLEWLIDTLDFNLQEPGSAQRALDKRHASLSLRRGNALLEERIRTRAEEPPRFHKDENGELVREARAEEGSGDER